MALKEKKVEVTFWIAYIIFNIAIYQNIYLYKVNDNSIKWLFVFVGLFLGIALSLLPDIYINFGYEISINAFRISVVAKVFALFVIYVLMIYIGVLVTVLLCCTMSVIDMLVSFKCWKDLKNQKVSIGELKKRLDAFVKEETNIIYSNLVKSVILMALLIAVKMKTYL